MRHSMAGKGSLLQLFEANYVFGIKILKVTKFACGHFRTFWYKYLVQIDHSSRRYKPT